MKSFRMSRSRVLTVAASVAALLAVDLIAAPPKAEAQTAARVESRTRPNFGLLLDPPTRPHRRRPRRSCGCACRREKGQVRAFD